MASLFVRCPEKVLRSVFEAGGGGMGAGAGEEGTDLSGIAYRNQAVLVYSNV